jgi:ATP-dependent Lon protease
MIDPVLYIQRKYRLYSKIYKKINNEIDIISNYIYTLMVHINNIYNKDLLNHQIYFRNISKLEDIYTKFNILPKKFTLFRNYLSLKQIRDIITYINNKLIEVCYECGMNSIENILVLNNYRYVYNDDNINLIFKTFIPTSYKIYNKSYIESIKESNIDYMILKKLKYYKCVKLNKYTNMLEYINGGKVFIVCNKGILVLTGFFEEDVLNTFNYYSNISKNSQIIKDKLTSINYISSSFKKNYMEQMRIRDILIHTSQELIDLIISDYQYIMDLKDINISSIVKLFLTKEVEEQYDIIKLFLLMDDDPEIQYLANLLYDMISTESYLLKSQPLSSHIYNSLHWSLQKKFKNSVKIIENNQKNDKEYVIPYEKQIQLLRVPDNVKRKALEKYNDVLNKGGENSSKSQQYLDGLLKIPFKIYKKEPIIKFIDDFRNKLCIINNQLLSTINYYNNKYIIDNESLTKLNNLCQTVNNKPKSSFITKYLDEVHNISKTILDRFYDYTINDNNSIMIENCMKSYKLDEIKILIKIIGISINMKQRKINIIKETINYFNSITNTISKISLFYYILNRNVKILTHQLDNEEDFILFYNNFKVYYNEWNNYKKESCEYMNKTKDILNNAVYSQNDAKNEIERIIAQWINGEMNGYCFGFEGPPGTGKTSLAKKGIAQCLQDENGGYRPFAFIAVGGSSNASILEGHSYTYVGSSWGKIIDILIDKNCMNPIIYIDELDKISKTENGKEIIGLLTHITDSSQNEHFNDKYFSGIDIDLSKILFIFSYNDFNQIDPILADRIHRIKFSYLSKYEKIHIINNYILKEILDNVGFDENQIIFDKGVIEFIITKYTYEAGIRKLKEKVFEIIREINLMYIKNRNDIEVPIIITKKMVNDIFANKLHIIPKLIAEKPQIGMVNGLFATTCGNGGLTLIEIFKTLSDSKLSLLLTGQQGDVMKESMKCAKTIAWNIIPDNIKTKINKEWEDKSWGLHIHCPEAATPKDGPSAGGAITLAIISRLCNIPVNNKIALTGEINLNGEIHAIGGLDIKIDGGKNAGVEKILFPHENLQDLELIKRIKPEILDNIEVVSIKTIWDILDHCLEEHDIEFNKQI